MYCPSCGLELVAELSYCNRCGANLKSTITQAGVAPAKLVGAAWAIAIAVTLVTVGGFGMVFSTVMALIDRGINLSEGGMVLLFFSLLFILTIDWLLIRQLSRVLSIPQLSGAAAVTQKPNLVERPAPPMIASREPASSVTDHTTRTLEPVPRERSTEL